MSRMRIALVGIGWLTAVAFAVAFAGLFVLLLESPQPVGPTTAPAAIALYTALFVTLPSVGALIALRVPGNAIGWLFIAAGNAMAFGLTATMWAEYTTVLRPDLPAGPHAQQLSILFVVGLMLVTGFLLFLFPTGRPLTPRWRVVFTGLAAVFALGVVATVLSPSGGDSPAMPNPFALSGGLAAAAARVTEAFNRLPPLFFLIAVTALVTRYRRSTGIERAQLKWFTLAAGIVGSCLGVSFAFSALGWQLGADIGWLTAMSTLLLLPVAVGMAITRYHLYDIDRLISRTVTYGGVTLVLAGCYALAVLSLGSLVGRSSDLAVAASTLLVAALFGPLRRWMQAGVDRRFNRARYDAQHTVEGFRDQLRSEVHLDEVADHLLAAVGRTVQPAGASLWLRSEQR